MNALPYSNKARQIINKYTRDITGSIILEMKEEIQDDMWSTTIQAIKSK